MPGRALKMLQLLAGLKRESFQVAKHRRTSPVTVLLTASRLDGHLSNSFNAYCIRGQLNPHTLDRLVFVLGANKDLLASVMQHATPGMQAVGSYIAS